MKRASVILASLLASLCVIPLATAQVTDVGQKVSDALNAYGPVPVTQTVQVPRTVTVCHAAKLGNDDSCSTYTVYDQKQQVTNQILKASNIRIARTTDVTFDPTTRSELPNEIIVQDASILDCTSDPATQQVTLAQSFQRTTSIAFTRSISNTASSTASFGWDFAVKVTGTITFGTNATTGQTSTTSEASTVTRTQTGSITIQPHTYEMAELRVWPVHYTAPFHATVVVDADLSQNDKGFHLLSDLLEESKRTFDITGSVEANDASAGQLVFYDLPYDATACHGLTGVVVKNSYVPKPTDKLRSRE